MDVDARRWIIASAWIGFGQQLYVVMRNQLIHDLQLPMAVLGLVQGIGAAAGVIAGAAGLWMLPRCPAAWALRVAALTNAAGFAVQVLATQVWHFLLGAAVAGVGIQMLTMASGPFLARRVTEGNRVHTYALQMVAIQTAPGFLGAVLGGEMQRLVSAAGASRIDAERAALAAGAMAVGLSLWPLRGLSRDTPTPSSGRPMTVSGMRRFSAFLAPDALLFFGAGLTVPFLQVHLRVAYGAAPHSVGWYFGAALLAGTLANLAAPRVAGWFGEGRLLALLQVGTAVGFVGLAAAGSIQGAALSLVVRYACSVAALPLWTAALHAALPEHEGEAAASWRMVVQSVAWAAANLVAGAVLTRGEGAMRGLLVASAVSHATAVWGCRRSLAGLSAEATRRAGPR